MTIIKETKWQKAKDLKGRDIMVKTVWEKEKSGKIYSRRLAIRQKSA